MIGRQSTDHWIATALLALEDSVADPAVDEFSAKLLATAGVKNVVREQRTLRVDYDIRSVTLHRIDELAAAHRIARQPGRWRRLQRMIAGYREDIRRSEQSIEYGWDSWIREIYVSRYKTRDHGRRDDRLKHWRQYLPQDPARGTDQSKNGASSP